MPQVGLQRGAPRQRWRKREAVNVNVDQLLAAGAIVRVGGADAWGVTRWLLEAGVRIGTEQQRTRHRTCRCARNQCAKHDDETSCGTVS
jgi:hypothetical protein